MSDSFSIGESVEDAGSRFGIESTPRPRGRASVSAGEALRGVFAIVAEVVHR
jgi:hypothetical protein